MLEELAYQYIALSEGELWALGYALTVIGGIAAGIAAPRTKWHLKRAPFFVYTSGLFAAISLSEAVWLNASAAIDGGYLWMLVATDVVVALVAGYILAVVAMARSLDAFDTHRKAYLAFIPLANLYLLLAEPRTSMGGEPGPIRRYARTAGLVVAGFVLLGAGGVSTAFLEQMMLASRSEQTEVTDDGKMIQSMIEQQGIRATLESVAREARRGLPQRLDRETWLIDIRKRGRVLQRTYRIEGMELSAITSQMRRRITNNICGYGPLRALIDAGVTVAERYEHIENGLIGTQRVTRADCTG